MTTCKLCNKEFDSPAQLHRHLRSEKMKVEDYYKSFYPRNDLFSGEPLEFKDHDSYFSALFSSRENMAKWFKRERENPEAQALAKFLLKDRKEKKGLIYAPCQVELRTIMCPSVFGIIELFGSYEELASQLGLKMRFKYQLPSVETRNDIQILIDTREQDPLSFERGKVAKLDTGDYTAGEDHYCDVYVERKSVSDFFSSFFLPKNFERVKREFQRASDLGFYMFVAVEGSINDCLDYQSSFVKTKGMVPHTFKNVRFSVENYPVQFVFCRNRAQMKDVILKIFSLGEESKNYDFEYLVEANKI